MANRQVYSWIAADAAAIAALQNRATAGALILNGTLGLFQNGAFGAVTLNKISRIVTLTSSNDLSGVTITVRGLRDGAIVSSAIAGPNNSTVVTTGVLFNVITSVTVSAAVTGLSVGTGQTGQTDWFLFNNQESVANLAIQAVISGTINYTLQVTTDVPNNAGTNPPAAVFTPTVFTPITALTGATANQLGNYTAPIKYANIIINSSTGAATLTGTFLQQGLHS